MKSDIRYAATDDGSTLAIIDLTHPSFSLAVTAAQLAAMSDQFLIESQQRGPMSPDVLEALKQSTLGSALMAAEGGFLSGLSTYMFKLGPDQLPADATVIDQHIASSFPAFVMRIRLQDMARLLADRLASAATLTLHRPVIFLNIAGGPAADTWNTLLHLQAEHPHLLDGRRIDVAIFDLDPHGPSFGNRVLNILCESGAPLSGLDVNYRHLTYNWSQTDQLPDVLAGLHAADAICAISSEGGLFEYGSDDQIIANLGALHASTAPDAFFVGSVTRDSELIRAAHADIQIPTRPRTLEAFKALVAQAGWAVQHLIERPMSYNVRLIKS